MFFSLSVFRKDFFPPVKKKRGMDAEALVDRNRCWLPRVIRSAWNKREACMETSTLQARPNSRLLLVQITAWVGEEETSVVWVFQLSADTETYEEATFLYERHDLSRWDFSMLQREPLETLGYWVWAPPESTKHVFILCKQTLELHRVRLPVVAKGWVGNTHYQTNDTIVLVTEEVDQTHAANALFYRDHPLEDAIEEVSEMALTRHTQRRRRRRRRKSLLPRADAISLHRSATTRRNMFFSWHHHRFYEAYFMGETVYSVHVADIAALLQTSDCFYKQRQSILRCVATGIGREDLPRVLLDLPSGLQCPPCWPWYIGDEEEACVGKARLLFDALLERDVPHLQSHSYQRGYRELGVSLRGGGLSARTSMGYPGPRIGELLQTERLVAIAYCMLRIRDGAKWITGMTVVVEKHTGRWLHVLPHICYSIHTGGRMTVWMGCVGDPSKLEIDLVWLDNIDTLRDSIFMDATPLPLDIVDLVLDYVDGGFWRQHRAALCAPTR